MAQKPTYAELERQIRGLETKNNAILETLREAEEPVNLNEARLETLLKLCQMTTASLKEITDFALEEAVRLTGSKIGYLAFMNKDEMVIHMYSWSKHAMEECGILDKPLVYPIGETGLWGEAVRQRKPVVTNDYTAENPLKKGYPKGHVPVERHMNVPVFDGDKIVVLAGVGNKHEPYDGSDLRQLTLLMQGMWIIVKRQRAEEKLHKLNKTLEQRVAERTAELENRTQQLQRLAFELSDAEDRERRHIASILHDDFQQELAYVKMELGILKRKADSKIGQKLEILEQITGQCIEKSRNLSYEINPPALHISGLSAALDALAESMKEKHGLEVTVRTQLGFKLESSTLTSILYRSARELIFNVVKHAGADSAVIDVRSKNGMIHIRVEDSGNGFDYDTVRCSQVNGAGFGLYSIEDRITFMGGSMKIKTSPGKGCRVVLTVPENISRKIAGYSV